MEYRKNGAVFSRLLGPGDIPGDQRPDCFQNGKELSLFLGQIVPVTDKESDVLLGYMEGHGYVLGCRDGRMYRGDLCCTEDGEIIWEGYTANDAVTAAVEWNFQMIEETADEEYAYIESLKEDEKILDALEGKIRDIVET